MQEKLTQREQEILSMMLNGTALKEIAYTLKIKYPTAAYHQKNMFRKLGVQNNIELLVNSLKEKSKMKAALQPPIIEYVNFCNWDIFKDNVGTNINVMISEEKLTKEFTCVNIYGNKIDDFRAYAGMLAHNTDTSREIMKKSKSFSFMALGDGKVYEVMLPTSDTRIKGGNNHYRKRFTTVKGRPAFFKFDVSELYQADYFGKPVPFIQDNVDLFQFQVYKPGDFYLKVWDVQFYL